MKKTIIKVRISEYLKQRAKDCAALFGWNLSKYIRFLIRMDIEDCIYNKIIPLISGNVDTLNEIEYFTHEGRRFAIVPENQVKKILK